MRKIIALIFLALTLDGCSESGFGQVTIPNIQITCATSTCRAATGSFYAVTIITRSGCAPDQVGLDDVAVGDTSNVICSSTGCTGTISSWRDSSSSYIEEIPSTNYNVCTRIDLDRNLIRSAADENSEENETILSSATIQASSWGFVYSKPRNAP